jgi:integrase
MSVYKRKGSPFYHYDFTFRGTRIRGCTKQTKKQLAGIVEGELMTKAREQGVEALLRSSPILQDFSVEFLAWVNEAHSIGDKTKDFYRNGWRLLKDTKLATMDMGAIENHDCETISIVGGNYNANQALSTLRRMFGKAIEMKRLFRKPKIKLRKVWGRSVAMTMAQAEVIASHMKPGDPRDALLILRGNGMRPKECFSMRWENLRLQDGYYQNPAGKTRTARRAVPLLGRSMEMLKRRHFEQGFPAQGWVFPSDSECGHMVGINKAYTAARKLAYPDLGALVLYTARHGVGTDLAAVVDLKTVMEALGHSDAKTALGYQHPNVSGLQSKLDAATQNRSQSA